MENDHKEAKEDGPAELSAFDAKLAMLLAFMDKWSCLPPQRSPQWYADRLFSVGASELATLLGLNPFGTIRKMIATKVDLVGLGDRSAMNWGNVLEHVCGAYMELIFDCKLYEMGAIPTVGMRNQRSSPDGVAVIKCLGDLIVSFEFKAPKSRLPKGDVPKYYRSQVLACLCAIEPADLGLFVDTVIRRCDGPSWSFTSRDYDYMYHDHKDLGDPLALSCLFFYRVTPTKPTNGSTTDPADALADEVSKLAVEDNEDVVDGDDPRSYLTTGCVNMGACLPKLFDMMLADTAEHKLLRTVYGPIYMDTTRPPDLAAEIAQHVANPDCAGYLPIKIMQCHIVPVKKEPGYVLRFQPQMENIIKVIQAIMDAPKEERPIVFLRECDANNWCKSARDPV